MHGCTSQTTAGGAGPIRRVGATAVALIAGLAAMLAPAVARADEPQILLGANTAGITSQTGAALDSFALRAGAMPSIAMYYQDWNEGWSTAILNPRFTGPIVARGATPMVSWAPMLDTADPVHQPACSPEQVASGRYDPYIVRAAREVAAFGGPVQIRLAWEMNGDWTPWGAGVDGNTPSDYVAMWRHVVSIFRAQGADNAQWVWAPNVYGYNGVAPFEPFYPGDEWVDFVGLDGYNWGAERGSGWRSFDGVFRSSYDALRSLTSKPVMLTEVGSAEAGGDKAAWIRSIPDALADMPAVRALIWFDREKETDWRIDSSLSSGQAFRELVAGVPFIPLPDPVDPAIDPPTEPAPPAPADPTGPADPVDPPTDPTVPTDPSDPAGVTPTPPADPVPWSPPPPPPAGGAGDVLGVRITGRPVAEGDHGVKRAVLRLRLSRSSTAARTFLYAVRGDTADARADFRAGSGTVRVPAGSRSATIVVRIRGDRRAERDERFVVALSDLAVASVPSTGFGLIRDDD